MSIKKSFKSAIEDGLMLGFPEYQQQAKAVASLAGIPYSTIEVHHFPDGESKITLPAERIESASHVYIYCSLDHPNEKLIELLLAAQGAKDLGVVTLTLIAPYLAYMRQDIAFHRGEVVSQKVIGSLLAEYFDGVLTVDSHLHRIQHLSEAIPAKLAINLTATIPMADFLQCQFKQPFLLAPDSEAEQWVKVIAEPSHFDYGISQKERLGDREVKIMLPDARFEGRDVVLIDDVASSGQTLIQAAYQLSKHDPNSISVLVTHALFKGDSIGKLRKAGVGDIWSCDSIHHDTNAVSLARLLADNL